MNEFWDDEEENGFEDQNEGSDPLFEALEYMETVIRGY